MRYVLSGVGGRDSTSAGGELINYQAAVNKLFGDMGSNVDGMLFSFEPLALCEVVHARAREIYCHGQY